MAKKLKANYFLLLGLFLVVLVGVSLLTAKRIASPSLACARPDLGYEIDTNDKVAMFEGKKIPVPEIADTLGRPPVLGVSAAERWIEVDLSEQKIRAWEGNSLFLESLISTGLPWWPTPKGEFTVQYKSRAQKMEGGSGKYYYYLPGVPYVMFFGNSQIPWSRGYSLHGTYWHSDFGTQRSHGCVNLPTGVAEQLYYWTTPVVPEGKGYTRDDSGSGTRVVIHD